MAADSRSVTARVAALEAHLAALDEGVRDLQGWSTSDRRAAVDSVLEGARAVPFTADDPFERFEHPVAGRVHGFRANPIDADAGDYADFEAVFRGSRERVAGLVRPYVDLLAEQAPVLDFGCGRGELVELLEAAGIEAEGVDQDAGMAEQARALGLAVEVGDGLERLAALASGSLGAVVSVQVVEHLPPPALRRMLELALDRLRPGGLFVAETVNPHAPHALKTFWVDLTHQHPLFPEVMLALAADVGFGSAFVYHPRGTGDAERDRFEQDSYALVARR